MKLPEGVSLRSLRTFADDRGSFTELFREEWGTGISPVQWNVVRSRPGVLRGVHAHPRHADYLTITAGRAVVGLRDLRPESPSFGLTVSVPFAGEAMASIVIPPGVAHGFYFSEESVHVYATDVPWSPAEELGCHWADPELGLDWPATPTGVSERDAGAGTFAALMRDFAAARPRPPA